ncbi:MAG TPA: VIT1/CCC1 transporter family protein [Kiritimatiellia bacterium]|nr:VIT1/CCC1 transporter family protein [Kiritimatiellia bacterium]HMP00372.1 VIT1/CCC1 transporter family protein [Kiritimatiellia bacterium]
MNTWIQKHLDPAARMSEFLFGLIMTLTFTLGAGLIVQEGPEATRELLAGVLGCNLAWGVIDGLFFVFTAMYERGAPNRAYKLWKKRGPDALQSVIDDYVNDQYGSVLSGMTLTAMRKEMTESLTRRPPPPVRFQSSDFMGALACFVMVVAAGIPAIIPFVFMDDRMLALRVSNLVMVALLYVIGVKWAATIDLHPQRVGLGMALGGLLLVQATILLGG